MGKHGVLAMIMTENKLHFLEAVHSMSLMNFSVVLADTSQSEFFVMAAIDSMEHGKNGVIGIADRLHVSSPAISRTITSLEKRGYAERYIDKGDRRSVGVRLTLLGKKIFSQECDRVSRFTDRVLGRMGEAKINELILLSDELLTTIGEELRLRGTK